MAILDGFFVAFVLVMVCYFFVTKMVYPALKDWQYRKSVEGKLRKELEEARNRFEKADKKVRSMEEDDPNYKRWVGVRKMALSDIHYNTSEIEELNLEEEEERMLNDH